MKQAALVPAICLQYKKRWDSMGRGEGLEGQDLTARARGPWLEVHGLRAKAQTARRGLEGQGFADQTQCSSAVEGLAVAAGRTPRALAVSPANVAQQYVCMTYVCRAS